MGYRAKQLPRVMIILLLVKQGKITTGTYNITYGTKHIYHLLMGGSNIGMGRNGVNLTTANGNVFIGYGVGYGNQTGIENVIVGYESLIHRQE